MSESIAICFNKPGCVKLPVDNSNTAALEVFRNDNPHIMADFIPNGVPFIVRDDYSNATPDVSWRRRYPEIAKQLSASIRLENQQRTRIAEMLHQFGSDSLSAIAALYDEEILKQAPGLVREKSNPLKPDNLNSYSSALAGVSQARAESFIKLTNRYQNVLAEINRAYNAKLPKHEILKLEQYAISLNKEMNGKFSNLLSRYAPKVGRKGTAWTNVQRGINQSKGQRNYNPLRLSNSQTFRQISKIASKAKWVGYGGLAVDGYFRFEEVKHQHRSDGNWAKTAAIETAGFGAGGAAGIWAGSVATSAVGAALGVTVAATPLGWVLIIGAGLAAGVTAYTGGDAFGKFLANKAYEKSASSWW